MASIAQRIISPKPSQAVLENIEAERQRIARDLHDSIGSMLSAAILLFDGVEAQNKERFFKVKSMLQETHREVRRIAHNITPACLQKLGIVSALNQYCNEINDAKLLVVYPVFSDKNLFAEIDHNMQVHVFRIVQEIIQNTIKHAQATQLDIILTYNENKISIIAQDNGIGSERLNSPIALRSIKERVKLLGGKIRVKSYIGEGTEVRITFEV